MFRLPNKFEYQVNAIIENHSNLPISITNMYAIFNKNKYVALLKESTIAEKKKHSGKTIISHEVIKSVKFPINIPAFEAKNVVIVFIVIFSLTYTLTKFNNTKTYDDIMRYFIIGGISILLIVGIVIYTKKKK